MRFAISSPLLRSVFAVGVGTAAGQAIAIALSPLITRIYSPEAFGVQGVFLSLLSILSPVSAMRYPMAIVIAPTDAVARALGRLSLFIAFGVSCLLGVVLLFVHQKAAALLSAETLGPLIGLLPLALFFVALQDIASHHAERSRAFRLIGIVTTSQALMTNLARILGGLVAPIASILVAVTTVAPAVQATMLTIGIGRQRQTDPHLTPPRARKLVAEYRDFPLFRMPTDVLNSASQSVPVIMLAALFSPAAAGLYTLARTVLNLPLNVVGNAIGKVLYTSFADLDRAERALTPLLLRATLALLALAPAIIGPALFAPDVFVFVFGEPWREAGEYTRWMALWIAVGLINVPATRVIPVVRQQRLALVFNAALLVVRVLSLWGGSQFTGTPLGAVAWYSISSSTMLTLWVLGVIRLVAAYDRKRKASIHGT